MKKTIFFVLLIGLAIPGIVKAQRGYTSFQYVIGFGVGDLGDYISKASFRGAVFDYQKDISDKASIGLELAWNTFYEKKDYDTYTIEPYSLSGIQYRYSNMFPMLLTAEYYFMTGGVVTPYVNLGIGTMYTKRETDMGTWRLEEKAWQFALKPELGLMYELGVSTSLKLEAKYYTGIKTSKLDTQSFFAISTGLVFLIY
jgi:opacity protein-like surface antigen